MLVLRRQLAVELPGTPVVSHGGGPVAALRGVQGLEGCFAGRSRLVRLLLAAVVAGFALRGVWGGTTPLIVLAGLALWVAALDALEPMAQETDHPGRRD